MARKKKTTVKKKATAKKKAVVKKKATAKKKAVVKKKATAKKKAVVKKKATAKKKAVVKKKATAKKKAVVKKKATAKKKTVVKKKATAKKKTAAKKYASIRVKLVQLKENLLSEAESAMNALPEQTIFPDLGDQATAETDRNFMLRLRGREQRLLNKIEDAIERIDLGSYGKCDSCDEGINFKRLLARPVATLCIECKTEQEEEEQLKK